MQATLLQMTPLQVIPLQVIPLQRDSSPDDTSPDDASPGDILQSYVSPYDTFSDCAGYMFPGESPPQCVSFIMFMIQHINNTL